MENEIFAAEVFLHPVNTSEATKEIDEELVGIEEQIKNLTSEASKLDYAVAVISGLFAGAIDAFVVKETDFTRFSTETVFDQIRDIFNKARIKLPPLEKVQKPVMKKAAEAGIPDYLPYLEKLASINNPFGLCAAVVLQMARAGMLVKKGDKIRILPEGINQEKGIILGIISAAVGAMKWLSDVAGQVNEDGEQFKHSLLFGRVCQLIRTAPAFSKIVDAIEKWQRQLLNEMRTIKNDPEPGMSVDKVFASFMNMLAAEPALNSPMLKKAVKFAQDAKRRGITDIPIVKMLNRQAFPVLINEILVRTFYFAAGLARELKGTEEVNELDWSKVLPFGNRTIDRMLTVSSMTLSIADTADAAIHAAIDSGGNSALFAVKFITRFNYVAAGRSAFAVVKEISYEKQQADLIHMKRLLTEAKTEKALEILQKYQNELEERVSAYLAEDIQQFLKGFDTMDRGLETKDSDLVIAGNVIIQRVLGREPQFTNQQEFNNLMDSDMPLML